MNALQQGCQDARTVTSPAGITSAGLEVYTPDVPAFLAYSNKKYLESPLSKDWPAGMVDRINAL